MRGMTYKNLERKIARYFWIQPTWVNYVLVGFVLFINGTTLLFGTIKHQLGVGSVFEAIVVLFYCFVLFVGLKQKIRTKRRNASKYLAEFYYRKFCAKFNTRLGQHDPISTMKILDRVAADDPHHILHKYLIKPEYTMASKWAAKYDNSL